MGRGVILLYGLLFAGKWKLYARKSLKQIIVVGINNVEGEKLPKLTVLDDDKIEFAGNVQQDAYIA